MSQLRLGRNDDGSRKIVVIDSGAVGRLSHTRYATKGSGGAPTVYGPLQDAGYGDDRARKNPDNEAVEAPITEVRP